MTNGNIFSYFVAKLSEDAMTASWEVPWT
jgi:hypothetical protein